MASVLTGDANTEEKVTIAKSACASAYAGMFPPVCYDIKKLLIKGEHSWG